MTTTQQERAAAFWPEWCKQNMGIVRRAILQGLPAVYAQFAGDFSVKESERADRAEAELITIDAVFARRPALAGCKTRYEMVELACSTAKRADEAERQLAEAINSNKKLTNAVCYSRAAERLACAKAVCTACSNKENLTNGQHCTEDSDGNRYYFECKAGAIWERGGTGE